MRRTKEEAEATRETLLDAAMRVFSRKGYELTRLEDIADEAKVTRGAIYHHFGGKAQVYQALTHERFAAANAALAGIMASGGAPLDVLRTLMIHSLTMLEDDADFRAMQEIILFRTPLTPELADGITAKIEGTREMIQAISNMLDDGKTRGDVRGNVNSLDAALAAVGLLNGTALLWLLDQTGFSLRERAAGVVDTFIDGLRA